MIKYKCNGEVGIWKKGHWLVDEVSGRALIGWNVVNSCVTECTVWFPPVIYLILPDLPIEGQVCEYDVNR